MGKEGGAQRRGRLPAVGAEEGGRGGAGGCCGYRPCWRRPLRAPPRGTSTSSSSWRGHATGTPCRRRRGRRRGLADDEAQRGDVVVELQQERVEAAGEAGGADRDDGRGAERRRDGARPVKERQRGRRPGAERRRGRGRDDGSGRSGAGTEQRRGWRPGAERCRGGDGADRMTGGAQL